MPFYLTRSLLLVTALALVPEPLYGALSLFKSKKHTRADEKPIDPSQVAAALASYLQLYPAEQIVLAYYGFVLDDAGVVSLANHSPRTGFLAPDKDLVAMYNIEALHRNQDGSSDLVFTTPPQSLASRNAGVTHRVTMHLDKNLRPTSTRDQRQIGSCHPKKKRRPFSQRKKTSESPVLGALSDGDTSNAEKWIITWKPAESSMAHLSTVKPVFSPRLARLTGFAP